MTNVVPSSHYYVLTRREFRLSSSQPGDEKTGIHLVSVTDDSVVTIRLVSGETLSASTNGYFTCREFGKAGLKLVEAFPKTGEAVFSRMEDAER